MWGDLVTPGFSARFHLAWQSLTAFAGGGEAEFGTGMSDPSASGWSSALGVLCTSYPKGG